MPTCGIVPLGSSPVDVTTWSRFFSLLALIALAGGVVAAASLVLKAPVLQRLRLDLGSVALPLAALVATVATLGSLYYSEVANFTPCKFCWYQRIAMYPLALILVIATVRRDLAVRRYAIPLALVGLALSVYHYQLQLFPDQASACDVEAPCTTKEVEELGFVTIPFMAGCGFLAIAAMLAAARPDRTTEEIT
jgi:disulfide bond formation protein DsbB